MKVYIANFGRGNYEWPECLRRNTIATMNDELVHQYWIDRDRVKYIGYCINNIKTWAGIIPTRSVASRWFNLMTIISESNGDVWIHREKDQIWWTVSRPDPPEIFLDIDPHRERPGESGRVYVCHKPCEPWSTNNKKGNRLEWQTLHPKAREFMFTEGTLQQLTPDNAAYALALITGDDLSKWHSTPGWQKKLSNSRKGVAVVLNARQIAIVRMASTAYATAAQSNGQETTRITKNKNFCFSTQLDLEIYLAALLKSQEDTCAITEIPLQFDKEADDPELLCSLDRIDSSKHYEIGNLQIVCRFVNRWKNNSKDEEFRRLIDLLRTTA